MKRSRIDAFIQDQEGLPEVTRQSLDTLALEKLNALLKREKERGGFYTGLPEQLNSLAELASLPFTTDEDLAHRAGGMLLCSQGEVERVLSDATSGTTGAAKRVFYTEGDLEKTVRLYTAGLGELIFPGSVTMVCFPFSGPRGLGELIAEAIGRLGARPLCLGPGLSFGEYAAAMEREKPDTFVGMPVQLLSILRACGKGSLERALVSGDACPESVTRACEEVLGAKLFPHYGSREMGMAGAITCPAHAGMHLRENDVLAEIIDPEGHVLPDGEFGELVITTVGMEALPLIRYRTGDYTRILSGRCPCGSEVKRLDTLRREKKALDVLTLDEALFSLDALVDCRYRLTDGTLSITALSAGALAEAEIRNRVLPLLPEGVALRIEIEACRPECRALYAGKRVTLT